MKYGKQFWTKELGLKWTLHLKDMLNTPYAEKLMGFINIEYAMANVKPSRENLFKSFRLCPWENVKVVIVGNEPHFVQDSNGLAYGAQFTSRFHTGELTNVATCIEKDYYNGLNLDFDFSLESWAKQGVLLLNTSLSVRVPLKGSHKKPWGKFNSAVLNAINDYKPGTIFILWGKEARSLVPHIKDTNYTLVYDCPGEYYDKYRDWNCPNFKEADKILIDLYGESIKW